MGINTAHPNALVAEAIATCVILPACGYATVRREVRYGKSSRVDFLLEDAARPPCCAITRHRHAIWRSCSSSALWVFAVRWLWQAGASVAGRAVWRRRRQPTGPLRTRGGGRVTADGPRRGPALLAIAVLLLGGVVADLAIASPARAQGSGRSGHADGGPGRRAVVHVLLPAGHGEQRGQGVGHHRRGQPDQAPAARHPHVVHRAGQARQGGDERRRPLAPVGARSGSHPGTVRGGRGRPRRRARRGRAGRQRFTG